MVDHKINQVDDYGFTALQYAVYANNLDLVRSLISQGADLEKADFDGLTPLHRAAYWNRVEIAKVLIDAGANIQALAADNSTLLHRAVSGGAVEMVQFLLTQKIDVNALDSHQDTALDYAKKMIYHHKPLISLSELLISACSSADEPIKPESEVANKEAAYQEIIQLLTDN